MEKPQDCFDFQEGQIRGANAIHSFRYYLARGFIEPGDRVIDASCGYGTGTHILSRSKAQSVTGIDKGEYQLKIAVDRSTQYRTLIGVDAGGQSEYDVNFFQEDLDTVKKLPQCDYLVSIETIEHLEDPKRTLEVFKECAKKMFLSVPIIPTKQTNRHHKHDFNRHDFINLVQDDNWKIIHSAVHGNVHEMFMFQKV